jgi:hypothetical protein
MLLRSEVAIDLALLAVHVLAFLGLRLCILGNLRGPRQDGPQRRTDAHASCGALRPLVGDTFAAYMGVRPLRSALRQPDVFETVRGE